MNSVQTLKDYPTMTVFSPTSGRPAAPFNATIVASPKQQF
jgi:hypothetical protein